MKSRVLIVDDNRNIRVLVKYILGNGYSLAEAADGLEAWEKMSRAPFDFLISDIQMPRMTGLELSARVKASYPATRIILMSAEASIPRQVVQGSGAEEFLPKPFHPEELLRAVSPPARNS